MPSHLFAYRLTYRVGVLDGRPSSVTTVLDHSSLTQGVRELTGRDPRLAAVIDRHGPPPLWPRSPGFPTLIHLILEQQVSVASAQAAFDRLVVRLGDLTPSSLLDLDDTAMRAIGFSRQKTAYARGLARAILDGSLDLESLVHLRDDQVRSSLTALKGIGPWTANTYLLMALRRPDVWPDGDIAAHAAYQEIAGLPERPSTAAMVEIARQWSPWRAVAARILWFHYLDGRE